MTTEIIVKANHGWPVDVTPVSRGHLTARTSRVPAGESRSFFVHSGQDLLVHEVQPDELADKAKALTEGQYRVGVSFNPSQSAEVDDIKRRVAELIDTLNGIASNREHPGARCAAIAMTELESAAMWAVKAITKPAR